MKEYVLVAEVQKNLCGSFNKLCCSDDVNEEPNGSCIVLSKLVIDVFGILNIKTC
jgi:hypothetical protein